MQILDIIVKKDRRYIDIFNSIYQFNTENLSQEESNNSAFNWFIDGGYRVLHQKSKVTIPIENRFPAKKSIANNYNIKRHSNVIKNESEWGYVAQLERLDLERAREDCWVTFKAGKGWNYESFYRAVTAWKKTVKLPTIEKTDKKLICPTIISPKKKKTQISPEKVGKIDDVKEEKNQS